MLVIHENKEDYTPAQVVELTQAFNNLDLKAQGGKLTLEETRTRVAYNRLKREENFKIVLTTTKKVREPKEPKLASEVKERKPRTKKVLVPSNTLMSDLTRAGDLFSRKKNGEVLSEVDESFLTSMLSPVPEL